MKTIAIILIIAGCAVAQDTKLYEAVVYMAQHRIGDDSLNRFEENALLDYLQRAFGINDTMHREILLGAKNAQAPAVYLNVQVIGATELISKDPNGKSDPFCTLYLESTPDKRHETAVKNETLTPVWEEEFYLESQHPETDTLCLEVWDYDPAETVMEKLGKVGRVHGIRGLRKLVKEMPSANSPSVEFIGRCTISLKDIPVAGHEIRCRLEKPHRLDSRGIVHLRLAFVTERNSPEAIEEHRELLVSLASYELGSACSYRWNGQFPAVAEAIILQHQARKGLTARNAALSRWAAFASVHRTRPLHFAVFHRLVDELIPSIAHGQFSSHEAALFWQGVRTILASCFESIGEIQVLGDVKRTVAGQLEAISGIISAVSSVEAPNDFDPLPITKHDRLAKLDNATAIDFPRVLEWTVVERANGFWDRMLLNNTGIKTSDRDAIEYRLGIVRSVLAEVGIAWETCDQIFVEKFNFPYARTLHTTFQRRIMNLDMTIVQDVCRRLNTSLDSDHIDDSPLHDELFELYAKLRSFDWYGRMLRIDEPEDAKAYDYHGWFKPCIRHWLDNVVTGALASLGREASNVSSHTSAIDIASISEKLKIFWNKLAWPDVAESLKYLDIIIPYISRCSIGLAENISAEFERATGRGLEESGEEASADDEPFEVPPIWCTAVNTIDRARTSIAAWGQAAHLRDDDENRRDRRQRKLKRLIEDTADELDERSEKMLERIVDKIAPTMNEYLVGSAAMFESTSANEFTEQLLQYINDNMGILHGHLNKRSFRRIALIIWQTLLEMLDRLIESNIKRRRPASFYSNLGATLGVLVNGFSAMGADDAPACLELLRKIEPLLTLHGMETDRLIHLYDVKRVEEQDDPDVPSAGVLTVGTQFVGNLLTVQIFGARDLRLLLHSGGLFGHAKKKSTCRIVGGKDTFVRLRLLPGEKFEEIRLPKTRVQNDTLEPSFHQVLEINLTPEQQGLDDAILVFEMRQKINSARSKFMAEAFLPFSKISHYTPGRRMESLQQKQLKLSRPDAAASRVARILKNRKGEKKARKFISELMEKTLSCELR